MNIGGLGLLIILVLLGLVLFVLLVVLGDKQKPQQKSFETTIAGQPGPWLDRLVGAIAGLPKHEIALPSPTSAVITRTTIPDWAIFVAIFAFPLGGAARPAARHRRGRRRSRRLPAHPRAPQRTVRPGTDRPHQPGALAPAASPSTRCGKRARPHIAIDIGRGILGRMYGSFIRAVRSSRGLSQAQLAEITGVSQPNLSAMENDRRMPSADTLNKVLVACGYELAAVAGGRQIFCPLPLAGWFPDDGDPGPVEGDPADEPPTVRSDTSIEDRLRVIEAVLDVAAAQLR